MAEDGQIDRDRDGWPERRYVCLHCRATACEPGDHALPGHDLVSVRATSGRDRLVEHVWGRRLRNQSSTLATPAELGAISFAITAVSFILNVVDVPWTGAVCILSLLAGVGFFFLDESESDKPTDMRRERDQPLAAAARPARLAGGAAVTGIVEGRDECATAPVSGSSCVAFAVTVYASVPTDADVLAGAISGAVTLRDGATVGFTIVTQDGNHVLVPPGPIELIFHNAREERSKPTISSYLRTIDRLRQGMTREADPFVHARAREAIVVAGDHVALYNPIVRTGALPGAAFTGYRDAPASSFRIQGTPCVELLDAHEESHER